MNKLTSKPPINTGNVDVPLVIYHGNCADGFSAAWVFHNDRPDYYDFHAGFYSDAPPDVTGRRVFLVDFSYKRAVVEEMLKVAKWVTIIDHHATAIDDLAGLSDEYPGKFIAHFNKEQSGATLAWDVVFDTDTPRPLLLGHIEDRDLWKFKLPLTREISAAVFSYEYTFDSWDRLMAANQAELLVISANGAAIERKHHKDIAELVKVTKRYFPIGIKGSVIPTCSLPYTLSSDAGHLLCEQELVSNSDLNRSQLFAACYWDTATHRIFSLRSLEDGQDVSEIAKQFGGGGHKHAAGFSVMRSQWLALI